MNAVATQSGSVLIDMATRYGMQPDAFELTVRATCSPKGKDARPLTREEFAAFLLVAREYRLNPLLKEIYAFPAKHGGGIIPVVGIDGWINMVNSHPAFDGMEFAEDHNDKGGLTSTECCIWRKDRTRPTKVREHYAECYRDTEAWKGMPHRMLRHKALIQTARIAFGFGGIYDEEEAETIAAGPVIKRVPPPAPKVIEHIDPETGEVTKIEKVKKPSKNAQDGSGTDSSAAARQGSQGDAAPSGSPTQAPNSDDAFREFLIDMAHAPSQEELDHVRDDYMTQWGIVWTRAQKEDAAESYSISCDRISRLPKEDEYQMGPTPTRGGPEGTGPEDPTASPEDDFPGDTPAVERPKAAAKPKTPPKPPKPAQEAAKATEAHPATAKMTAEEYEAEFFKRYDAVDSREGAVALKSWWFASATPRNAAGISGDAIDKMRNAWLARIDDFPMAKK